MRELRIAITVFLTALFVSPAQSFAVGSGGFENASFSAKQYGRAFAVTAAPEEDPAAISYNPAAINDIPGIQIQNNAHFLNMWTKMESSAPGGGSSTGSGTTSLVPTTYITVNPGNKLGLNNRLAFGLGFDAPFGLSNKYDSNYTAVHNTGYKNWLKMFAIKPVASVRLANWLSIGAGPIWYRIFDLGQIAAYPNSAITNSAQLQGLGLGSSFQDGQIRGNMSGNAWGWQMGILAKPHPKHKLGFYFRSPVLINAKGLLKGENIVDPNIDGGFNIIHGKGSFETGIHAKVHLPLNMSWGYNYKINDKTDVGADFGFTRWSVFDNLNIVPDPINGPLGEANGILAGTRPNDQLLNGLLNTPGRTGGADKDWRNAFTLALGGAHKVNEKLTLRSGILWYFTPAPKSSFVPGIPDANRLAFSFGLGYKLTKHLELDTAYMPIFFMTRHIDNDIGNPLGSSVDGKYSSFLHVWTFGLTYKLGVDEESKTEDWEGQTNQL